MHLLSKILINSSLISGILFSQQNIAHSRYMLPSHTSLSGDEAEMVSLDLSVSNDLFHPDRAYGGNTNQTGQATNTNRRRGNTEISVLVTAPDGSTFQAPDLVNLGRKSATYVNLDQDGTYKMTVTTTTTERTTFTNADGSTGRSNGLKQDIHLPDGATNVKSFKTGSRVETFVTRNDMTRTVLELTGEGIELGTGTHPNDFFVGEEIDLQFLLNGEPVAEGTEILIVLGGTRHRNERAELNLETDSIGRIQFEFPEAGFYFLEMSAQREVQNQNYDYDSHSYSASFEVWPE